jgi:hypothetical protein
MADVDHNTVATAVRGADFEGFLASTLFSQGWSVTLRALDIESLLAHIDTHPSTISLLLISTDIEGLTTESLLQIKKRGIKYFLFSTTTLALEDYPEAVPQPTSTLELLGLVRGSLRSPMIRTSTRDQVRARTIALATPTTSVGCTTLSINLGAELAHMGHKVLIVDAHAYFPAFATRLGIRGLKSSFEYCNISPDLWALEVTQLEIVSAISALDRARAEFDFILVDHGCLKDFPAILTGRRWCSEALIWSTTYADELWILSKTDLLSIERLKLLTGDMIRNSIKPQISFIRIQSGYIKRSKNSDEMFLQIVTPLKPRRILQYPFDSRGTLAAEEERTTLLESNERGILRKSIAHIAGELIS